LRSENEKSTVFLTLPKTVVQSFLRYKKPAELVQVAYE